MIVFAISNHKGGVGKTTSAVNLGAAFAAHGLSTLLIDLDPQANLSQSLGVKVGEGTTTIYGGLRGQYIPEPVAALPNLSVIPSTIDLSAAEVELAAEAGREYLLKELLSHFAESYQIAVIDCPPSLALLTLNAMAAANYVLVPVQAEFLAMQGLAKLVEVIGKIQKRLNPSLQIGGVFVTQYDARKVLSRDVADSLEAHFPGQLCSTRIRDNVTLAEAPGTAQDVFRYSPDSHGAEDYLKLAKELAKKFGLTLKALSKAKVKPVSIKPSSGNSSALVTPVKAAASKKAKSSVTVTPVNKTAS